jgi:hypothetical protein
MEKSIQMVPRSEGRFDCSIGEGEKSDGSRSLHAEKGTGSSGTVFRSTLRGLRSGLLGHDLKEFDLEY